MSKKKSNKLENIEQLVYDCISTNNEIIIVELIERLQDEYIELAQLSSYGEYKTSWSHLDLLNYLTYNT